MAVCRWECHHNLANPVKYGVLVPVTLVEGWNVRGRLKRRRLGSNFAEQRGKCYLVTGGLLAGEQVPASRPRLRQPLQCNYAAT